MASEEPMELNEEIKRLRRALHTAVKTVRRVQESLKTANHARKLMDALSGDLPGYDKAIDEIHAALQTPAVPPKEENLRLKLAQAESVIRELVWKSGHQDSSENQRALKYFSDDVCDEGFLPWPRE